MGSGKNGEAQMATASEVYNQSLKPTLAWFSSASLHGFEPLFPGHYGLVA